ncbi:MAG: helix-turn-helix transcriptional regulator [Candidatus Nomurabacteria bacterium]|nr:helix-turn-helix transcriptional regulator [Candidatus Nomurabacteria bacterium]USN87338.1 MAG: helix-turn-helix transcriptional regulator [Candidatus Nomurabacteria bacterium]
MNTELINKVLDYRLEAGLTQVELAERVGVTRQTIISIEKGNYIPSVVLALRLAKVFRCPLEKLFIENKK